ncbi:putative sensor domain DACNV-containing protein [Magnetococcales bacterium HHB-1]
MFDHHIIEQVIELWHEGSDGESQRLLDFDQVKHIMETVFLASLKREEDRPVQVSVGLLYPGEIQESHHGAFMLLELEKETPFSVDSLIKLAPAFDPTTTTIVVYPEGEERDQMTIWGSLFSSRRGRNRFDPQTIHAKAPDMLVISSVKPGSLSIFRGDQIIARFNAGRFTEPTPTPFTASLIGWNLMRMVKKHQEFKTFGVRYWRIYRDAVDRLLMEASKRGHGGTIVWLSEEMVETAKSWIVPKYVLEDSNEGLPVIQQLCQMEQARIRLLNHDSTETSLARKTWHLDNQILEKKRRIVELVELLAQLTRVDGALIVTDRLRPLSFGSVLVARPWQEDAIFGSEDRAYPPEQVDLGKYGTRHNSAVNFVGKCPGSVAFVLSQDGPISALTRKDEETIYWWPDCLSKQWTG